MTKFKSVLSDGEIFDLLAAGNKVFSADSDGDIFHDESGSIVDWFDLLELLRSLEQAVLAKLHEQKPIGYLHANEASFLSSKVATAEQARELDYNIPMYADHIPDASKMIATGGSVERRARIMSAVESYADIAAMHMRGCGTVSESDLNEERKALELQISAELTVTMESAISSLEGWQLVPTEPDIALLASMAMCLNLGLGLLPKESQDNYLHDMRKLHNEVIGRGYYSPSNRERYLSILADAPKYTGESNGN